MSNPFFIFTKKELIFLLAVFILGFILGMTILNLFLSQRIDQLILEKKQLKSNNQEYEEQIKKLNENLQQQRHHFIQKFVINLECDLNQHTQQELKEEIRQLISRFMGREINKVDPFIIHDIINDRPLIIENNTYYLHLNFIVIQEELKLYITVKETTENKKES